MSLSVFRDTAVIYRITNMLIFCVLWCFVLTSDAAKPNIVLIIADDLGWNDVGFHGSNQIPTPNIDALAYSGVILQNYYVNPICTPSRSALMTGKYPIHTGMQHSVLFAMERRGLPLSEKLLPQYLKTLDYKTHLVGKWHLGFFKKEYTPLYRGFDSHVGFWSGRIDHYDHTSMENGTWGTDFRRDFKVAHDLFGKYVTDIYTEEATKIIMSHKQSEPLFLTVAHSAMHSGNPNDPIRAPYELINRFTHIQDAQRRKYAAVLTKLDESVGKVTAALDKAGLLNNTIIIFTTDNGGAPQGFNDNAGSNWPLRGVKNTLWEGGVRGAGFIWSPLIQNTSRVATQRMHVADWLPTLFKAAGGNISIFENIDGINQWEALTQDLPSDRLDLLHNIDDIWGSAAITIGQWKLHKGTNYKGTWDSWYGPGGREGSYDTDLLYTEPAGKTLQKLGLMPNKPKVLQLRDDAIVKCDNSTVVVCKPLVAPCLYDIENDPCERLNLAEQYPDVVEKMLIKLQEVSNTAVPPSNTPLDSFGDPKYWSRIYMNFGDYETMTAI